MKAVRFFIASLIICFIVLSKLSAQTPNESNMLVGTYEGFAVLWHEPGHDAKGPVFSFRVEGEITGSQIVLRMSEEPLDDPERVLGDFELEGSYVLEDNTLTLNVQDFTYLEGHIISNERQSNLIGINGLYGGFLFWATIYEIGTVR